MHVEARLKESLKGKVALVGIGEALRADDGAGPALISRLKEALECGMQHAECSDCGLQIADCEMEKVKCEVGNEKSEIRNPKSEIDLFDCGSVPENYLGKIVNSRPDTVLIVDAGDFKGKPGELRLIEEPDALEYLSPSTHNLPLTLFIDYLKSYLPQVNILFLAIQPGSIEVGEGMSDQVEAALERITGIVHRFGHLKNR
ncbi:MAG: hydrogenase 3 maturation endopeptidase HyCI [bacterium]|nr:hydrogenase 3 maturation endopeptidase HyCI [bacterium]